MRLILPAQKEWMCNMAKKKYKNHLYGDKIIELDPVKSGKYEIRLWINETHRFRIQCERLIRGLTPTRKKDEGK